MVDGFAVTGSLSIPRRTGVLAGMENMTSGALSVGERPFHAAKPNEADLAQVGPGVSSLPPVPPPH